MSANSNLRLTLQLRANADGSLSIIPQTTRNINQMGNATDQAGRSAANSSRNFSGLATNALDVGSAARAAAGGLSLIALYASGKGLVNYADNLQMLDARIKGSTSSVGDFNLANSALVDLSLKTHSALEGNVQLFTRTNKSVEAMGGSMGNTVAFVDMLAKSLKISGTATSEQAGLTRQVAQALASGVLRGDEYNSVMENGARFAYALADGLGVNVGALRAMAEAGALTTDKVFPALLSQSEKLTAEFNALPVSVAAAFNNVDTQFGRYIHGANSAHQSTSDLAAGVDKLANNLPPILDGLVTVGKVAVLAFASQGLSALITFSAAQAKAVTINAAHAQAIAMDRQFIVEHAQAQLADVEATNAVVQAARLETIARLQATNAVIASIRADIQRYGAMANGTALTRQLAIAEQQRSAVLAELGLLGQQQARINTQMAATTAQLTAAQEAATVSSMSFAASLRLLLNPLNLLNVAIAGYAGYEFGSWLSGFDTVANAASNYLGKLAHDFENVSYWAAYSKAAITGNWSSLDTITAAHERNTRAIDDNVNGSIAYRTELDKANLSQQDYKDLTLSLRTPAEMFQQKTADITAAFNQGLVPLDKYIARLGDLRDEMDRLNRAKLTGFQKEMEKVNTEIFNASHSPLENKRLELSATLKDPIELNLAVEAYAKLFALQDEQKLRQQDLAKSQKAARKEDNQAAKEAERMAKDYADTVSAMQRELDLHGKTGRAAALEWDIANGILDKFNEKQQLKLLNLAAELDFKDQSAKFDNAEKQAMEGLVDKYNQLTLSARAYYAEKLKADGVRPEAVPALLVQYDKTAAAETAKTEIDANHAALKAYNSELDEAKTKTATLGDVTAAIFDSSLGGIHAMAGAFDSMVESIDKSTKKLDDNRAAQALNAKEADPVFRAENERKYAAEALNLNDDMLKAKLGGARKIAGALESMLKKGSTEQKAAHAVTMALAGVELAMDMKKMLGIGMVTAAETASVVPSIAASTAKGGAKAAEAVATQASAGPYIGFALMAAMAVAMAAIGFSVGGGGSISTPPPPTAPDTGTVLGDSTAQSQSVGNVVKTLKDIHAQEYPELRGINAGIAALSTGITDVVTRLFQAGGINGAALSANTKGPFDKVLSLGGVNFDPILNWIIGGIFGGATKYEQTGGGIVSSPTDLLSLINGQPLKAEQYATIKKSVDGGWFGSDSVSYTEQRQALNVQTQQALDSVFQNMGVTMLGLAVQLGNNTQAAVEQYVIPEMKIDLYGLSGEDAVKKLNGVISTQLDTMASAVFGAMVGQYQKLGEGMLETTVRIVSEIAVVNDALAQSGLTMGKDAIAISDALVQTAGGLKDFQDQFASYYDKFYSDQEKQARLQDNLGGQLNAVGLGLASTREGYRALVDALDLNNAKDRERYSLLIGLAGAADTYYGALESGLKTYQDTVKSAYDTASSLLKGQVDTYRNFVNQLKGFSDSLITGNLSTASPADKYRTAKAAFVDIRQVLATGTDAQKETALGKLQSVTQQYLEASRAYNASGIGYVKDFADAQALLAKEIGSATVKADVAQGQLDALTEQVTALGLIKTSVDGVGEAIAAVGLAIEKMNEFQAAQEMAAHESANKAAFNKQEAERLAAYNAPAKAAAAAKYSQGQAIEGMVGWSANTSAHAFSAEGDFNAATGATVGAIATASGGGSAGSIAEDMRTNVFPRVSDSLAFVAEKIHALVGGVLPQVHLKFGDDQSNGKGYAEYAFAGKQGRVDTDSLPALQRIFADDITDYLAAQLDNAEWQKQIMAVGFPSLGAGLSALSTLMADLKNPYKAGAYDPNKDYTKPDGSHANGLARVPFDGYIAEVHKDERILTATESATYNRLLNDRNSGGFPDWLNNATVNRQPATSAGQSDATAIVEQLKQAVAELKAANLNLEEQVRQAKAGVAVDQAGYKKLLDKQQRQLDALEKANRQKRIKADA